MKKHAAVFLAGLALGASLILALCLLSTHEPPQETTDTLDFLIEEWTSFRVPLDSVLIAQLSRQPKELPDARVGFFPDTVRELARCVDSLYHVPKGVTLAQWALESKFGLSDLGARNYFGHTAKAMAPFRPGQEYVLRREQTVVNGQITTGQAVRFAKYNSIAECFDTHGRYLSESKRYEKAFRQKSPERFARELAGSGYATDPDYALKLIAIMRRYKL